MSPFEVSLPHKGVNIICGEGHMCYITSISEVTAVGHHRRNPQSRPRLQLSHWGRLGANNRSALCVMWLLQRHLASPYIRRCPLSLLRGRQAADTNIPPSLSRPRKKTPRPTACANSWHCSTERHPRVLRIWVAAVRWQGARSRRGTRLHCGPAPARSLALPLLLGSARRR